MYTYQKELYIKTIHMSYSIAQAKDERSIQVNQALQERDTTMLHVLSELYKEEGEDETADELRTIAKRIDRDDWAYDNAIGN